MISAWSCAAQSIYLEPGSNGSNAPFIEGMPISLTAGFLDRDLQDSLAVDVDGLPPGVFAVRGAESEGDHQIRLYGIAPEVGSGRATYRLRWTITGGTASRTDTTDLTVEPDPATDDDVRNRTLAMVTRNYFHGMPRYEARMLGRRALPILATSLRDEGLKGHWAEIACAIGFIGDTAYFDTLDAFIWKRFSGTVDLSTYGAMKVALASMSVMATESPRVLDYLIRCANPETWESLPWRSRGRHGRDLWLGMAEMSVQALGYTDAGGAARALAELASEPYDPSMSIGIHGARTINAEVRRRGFVSVWREEDRRLHRSPGEGG
ncbi:MAG: hypothetical protein ACM3JJ_00605 [Hyphomicrobiales bacterium]